MEEQDLHDGVLATVGMTKSNELIAAVSTATFAQRLSQLGSCWLRCQMWT